ncbi:hypothetical protein ACIQ4I_12210 [Rummeliibacillus sp. NPDC094406]|uniref:hypothetical protein n=1 Tax=Rummeliibacillus sp. NPDC094406 TaxID=3364511 RepID=UPI00382FAD2C
MAEKVKDNTKIQLVSGQIVFEKMTNKIDSKEYAERKAWAWLGMVNDGKKPTRWLKPNCKGTKVNFDFIQSQEEYEKVLDQIEPFLKKINRAYGLDYNLRRGAKQ